MENKRKSGILLHPTSLPSPYGIGDMGKSAYNFIDFLHRSGQSLWQILPMGPTGFKDSPYQSYSAFAGNYYLVSIDKLVEDGLVSLEDIETKPDFDEEKVDYAKAIDFKVSILKKAFEKFYTENEEYIRFKKENMYWLKDYSRFAAIKDYYINLRSNEFESEGLKKFRKNTNKLLSPNIQNDYYYGAVWVSWEEDLVNRRPKALKKFDELLKDEIEYYIFTQYLFYTQWEEVKSYANSKGIEIIGDIPIFAAWDSADVWQNKELFYLDEKGFTTECAGVPPDYFSPKGQLWGNPLYNWDNHNKTGYKWWINRIKNTLKIADIIRIDHFRGFESYYAIKYGSKDATRGKWKKGPGIEFFDTVRKSLKTCPFIAEDLGIITEKVTSLRLDANLPGMKILQFAFDESENNAYLPHNYEKNCVVYTGTHDNDTTVGWYNSSDEITRDIFRRYMNTDGNNPSWDLIRLAYSSAADTAIFPLQDILSLSSASRMNTPGTEDGNWAWRFSEKDLKEDYSNHLLYLNKVFKRN